MRNMVRNISVVLMAAMLCVTAGAQEGRRWAVVELSSIYMRVAPDYESALETQELMGTVVEVVGEQGYWREIVSPQPYRAWCTEKGIVELSQEELQAYTEAPKCIFTGLYGHIYELAAERCGTICDLVGGDILRVVKKGRKWWKVMLPSGQEGWVPAADVKELDGFRSIAKGEGDAGSVSDKVMEDIIAEAFRLKGVPYLWGGMSSKGVDCSGLVRLSYLMNGILLPRNASQQIFCGDKVEMMVDCRFWNEEERSDDGGFRQEFVQEMSRRCKNLRRGDLVFFGTPAEGERKQRVTHVGIYIGNGQIIHSSHLVRVNSLIPGADDYYENAHRLLGAARL